MSKSFNKAELTELISQNLNKTDEKLIGEADKLRNRAYGKSVFFRGLIEFTNYCQNNCFYCGIRKSNKNVARYRLTAQEIINCCETGYSLGFRSFVLQGGEDNYYGLQMKDIIYKIKNAYPQCALTISAGEKTREEYEDYFSAGADRYLLRHETASESHYRKLHPKSLSLENRKKCLWDLMDIGFQTGAGFMVGSPFQKVEDLVCDLMFLKELSPHMVGIGPFIPHKDTPFAGYIGKDEKEVSYICSKFANEAKTSAHPLLNPVITMVALTRLILPKAMLPSTTALATISENGRELAIKAGANVVMPNLSPASLRENYSLYDNKAVVGCEAAESVNILKGVIKSIGFEPCFTRGDHADV